MTLQPKHYYYTTYYYYYYYDSNYNYAYYKL